MTSYRITPISSRITSTDTDPIYGEGLSVTLVDEGAGPFFEITDDENRIRVEMEELELLAAEGRRLMRAATGAQP
jgi:hypothetical protein